jgi:hypothetical protein
MVRLAANYWRAHLRMHAYTLSHAVLTSHPIACTHILMPSSLFTQSQERRSAACISGARGETICDAAVFGANGTSCSYVASSMFFSC